LDPVAGTSEPNLKHAEIVRVQDASVKLTDDLSLRQSLFLMSLVHFFKHPFERFWVHFFNRLNLLSSIHTEVRAEPLLKLLARNIVQHLVDGRLCRVTPPELGYLLDDPLDLRLWVLWVFLLHNLMTRQALLHFQIFTLALEVSLTFY
jgi:hypothetical protein